MAEDRKFTVLDRLHIDVRQRPAVQGTIRENRFAVELPNLSRHVVLSNDYDRSFINNSHFTIRSDNDINEELIEKAARGIEIEGEKIGKSQEARSIADELRQVKNKSKKEILECCVKLYTAETFLYGLINKVMREAEMCKYMFLKYEDQEYAENLGPYCALLDRYLCEQPNQNNIVVYRCASLTQFTIDDYKRNLNGRVWWDAFSSTTKNKNVALQFNGNTLFVIHIPQSQYKNRSGVDISSLSQFAAEEEILLHPAVRVIINEVKYDSEINKNIIKLTLDG